MINELFPFQRIAVDDLRTKTAMALGNFKAYKIPQVVSLQAPTGSGKTIIMAAMIEDVYCGSESYAEQPDAIFVWLSDSPQLNEQSKQKIEHKADRIRFDQCVVISEESFDQEYLDDGKIYFLNTQKLGKSGKLSERSDVRQYTIWETIENTAREKSDRLYFVIDEAHRGMQGKAAGTATTIMQRFIKGSKDFNLSPVPVVIGMSATSARFTRLVGETTSTLQKTVVSPAQVRASGLLKDRIIITYPDDPSKYNDLAVLQAATDEWIEKCQHWYQYTYEQHYSNVNPVFVVQVLASSRDNVSDSDLDGIIAKIEERMGSHFSDNEVVHTFGSVGSIVVNGLTVHHVEPSEIADNRKIRVVLFKENLSTGWDCPRAETMMSFRKAEDATYIAQLLGRMVRTPLQSRVLVDDSLNEVRLFLPYFNKNTVKSVVDELQNSEGGDIPVAVDGESIEKREYVSWSVHTQPKHKNSHPPIEGQISIFDYLNDRNDGASHYPPRRDSQPVIAPDGFDNSLDSKGIDAVPPPYQEKANEDTSKDVARPNSQNLNDSSAKGVFDREDIIRFINEQGYLTYVVKDVRINSYLKSLLSLAGLLTHSVIYQDAKDEVENDITNIMRDYIEKLHETGAYDDLAKQVLEFKLSMQVFDVFGESIKDYSIDDLLMTSESDIDRQLRAADAKLGGYGFPYVYGRRFINFDKPNEFKIDCILFASDDECIKKLNSYSEYKFHALNDKYRKYVVSKSEKCRKQYSDIVADGDLISKHNFSLPETISAKLEQGGDTYTDHLYADDEGNAIIKLNGWEKGVLKEEQKQSDYVCWLRNPSRQNWALRIPYEIDGVTKSTYPDFIIVRKDKVLGYVIDILEPHNPEFKDNLAKAKAFAKYAEAEQRIGRIELIRSSKDPAGKDRFKRLDMAKGRTREKVLAAINNDELDHIFDTDGEYRM